MEQISDTTIRRVLAAVVMAHPCRFPESFALGHEHLNAYVRPEQIDTAVVRAVKARTDVQEFELG